MQKNVRCKVRGGEIQKSQTEWPSKGYAVRLTAPYSNERRQAASELAKKARSK